MQDTAAISAVRATLHLGPVELEALLRAFCASRNLTYMEHGLTAEGVVEMVVLISTATPEPAGYRTPAPPTVPPTPTLVQPKPVAPKASMADIMSPVPDPHLHGAPESATTPTGTEIAGPTPGPLPPDDELANLFKAMAPQESTDF